MKRIMIFMLLSAMLAGCAQTIRTADLGKKDTIPSISFEAYFFVAGISERSRAVLLKHPDANVQIEPVSPEIVSTTASYSEALSFMKAKRGMRQISTQAVYFKDKLLGYLLTYEGVGINGEYVETNLTESGGTIKFNAREISKADD